MNNLSKLWRTGIALLLAICMVVGLCPVTAFATEEDNYEANVQEALDKLASLLAEISEENVAKLQAMANAVKMALEDLGVQVDAVVAELTAELEALEQELAEKNAQLENAVGEAKAEVEAQIAALEALIAEIKATIEAVEEALIALNEAVLVLSNAVETLIEEGVENVKAAIDTIQNAVIGVAEAVEALVEALPEQTSAKLDEALAVVKVLLDEVKDAAIHGIYTVTEESCYVALGDSTATGDSYVELVAEDLAAEVAELLGVDYGYANLSKEGLMIQDIFEVLAVNAEEIAKADLVTIGFGNNGFTNFMVKNVMTLLQGETVEFDWVTYVGEDGLSYVEEAKAELYASLVEKGVSGEFNGMELTDLLMVAVESYAYSYVAYARTLPEIIEEIHELSSDALVVLVGMYNPLADVAITMGEEELAIGEYLQYLVDAANVVAKTNSVLTKNVIYVDAPDVETDNEKTEMTILQFISEFVRNKAANLNPNEAGHAYIAEQILDALTVTKEAEEEEKEEEKEEEEKPEALLGDVNGDGKINHNDARLVLQHYVGVPGELDLTVADVDGNGRINHNDARLILQFYVGIITAFPVGK